MKCPRCKQNRQRSNFRMINTNKPDYRSEICRKCERQEKRDKGLCICGSPLASNRSACERCLTLSKESARILRQKDRKAALNHYGCRCVYCGETLEVFLTIDHINNDGNKHRRTIGTSKTGVNIYAWLRKNNYPPEFQVLCVNCNHAKGRVGEEALLAILKEAGRAI